MEGIFDMIAKFIQSIIDFILSLLGLGGDDNGEEEE